MIKDATIVEQPASSRSGPMQSGALELMDDDDVAISSGSCGMEGLAMLPVQTPVAPSNSVSQVQVLCDSSSFNGAAQSRTGSIGKLKDQQ